MTIAVRGTSAVATGTTSAAPSYPSVSAGDAVFLYATWRANGALGPTLTGWTLLREVNLGSLSTGARAALYCKDVVDGTETGTVTVTPVGGSISAAAAIISFSKTALLWSTATDYATDTSAGTNQGGSSQAVIDHTTGDILVGFQAANANSAFSSQNFTTTGVTYGTMTEYADGGTTVTSGNLRLGIFARPVTGGPATATTAYATSIGSSNTGGAIILRLREGNEMVLADTAGATDAAVAGLAPQSDDFNRADGTLGSGWVTTANNPTIASNKVVGGAGTFGARRALPLPDAPAMVQWAQATYQGSSSFIGVSVAMPLFAAGGSLTGAGTWYNFRQQGTSAGVALTQKDAGSTAHTALVSASGRNLVAGDVIRVEWDGTTLQGLINGEIVLTHTPGSPLSGQYGAGFTHGSSAQSGVTLIDDFSAGQASALSATNPVLNDTAGGTDSVTAALSLIRSLADAAGASDAAGAVLAADRALADSAGAADTATAVRELVQALADAAGVADTAAATVAAARTLSDAAAGSDAVATAAAAAREVADSGGAVDAVVAELASLREMLDAAIAADEVTYALAIARTMTELVGLTDLVDAEQAFDRPVADEALASDQLLLTRAPAALADVAGAADTVTATLHRQILLEDTAGASDEVAAALALFVELADDASGSDFALYVFIAGDAREVADEWFLAFEEPPARTVVVEEPPVRHAQVVAEPPRFIEWIDL